MNKKYTLLILIISIYIYSWMNELVFRWYYNVVEKFIKQQNIINRNSVQSILDFGNSTNAISKLFPKIPVTSLDIKESNDDIGSKFLRYTQKINQMFKKSTVEYKNHNIIIYDGYNIPFEDKQFDLVIVMFVLHHIEHQEDIIKELRRVAKEIIIVEDLPNSSKLSPSNIISRQHYRLFNQKPEMIKYMHTIDEWKLLLEKYGFIYYTHEMFIGSLAWPCNHFIMHLK